ncbi:hypothetical protein Hanom_Chr07g00612971 [Helianthus anomalus]
MMMKKAAAVILTSIPTKIQQFQVRVAHRVLGAVQSTSQQISGLG